MLLDHGVAPLAERGVVERDAIATGEAELGALLGHAVQQVSGLEHRLGRDAAAVQAGPAEPATLHQADLQPELRGADGADVAHPPAQDQQVEVLRIAHLPAQALAAATGADVARARSRPSHALKAARQASETGIGASAA